jgi:signal transduction histidine kinase
MKHMPDRPLDQITSIKVKLAGLIVGAVGITVFVFWFLVRILQIWPSVSGVVAGGVALVMVRVLARGMTSPLREMADASQAMARGDYSRRVTDTSRDEVGRLARAFNQMAGELAETDRLRRDLVANVSHELRTPLTSLQATLENLIDGIADADRETLTTMLTQVERLGRLVTQLLDLSRLEAGTVPLDRQDFAVEPVLAHAVREQKLHAPDVEIAMVMEDDGLVADGDPERVHQVVANLLENAVRHSPEGCGVEVRARRSLDRVTIEVNDEGPGIPEHEEQRVFERFYRADSARAARDGGAGLGLAIARWIVDLHGGDIHPERRLPHGCRMVVTLPRARPALDESQPTPVA